MKKHLFILSALTLLLSDCKKKEYLTGCYECTSFITYTSNLSTFKTPSPYTTEKETCSESEKTTLEKGTVKTETITGTYTLTTTTRTVCSPKIQL